jgi:ascorbate PTS system EIIC component
MQVLEFFINQIFKNPAYFMGIIVLVGCLLRKMDIKSTLVSVIKTVVGMMILSIGAGQLKVASEVIIKIFTESVGIRGIGTDMWTATAEALAVIETNSLANIGLIMISAWLVNLFLAKFTPIKTIFLTGHVAYVDTVALTFLIYVTTGLTGASLTIAAILTCGVYWWFFPFLLRKFLNPLLGDTPITLGHNLCISGIITTQLARLFGDKSESAENIKLPGWLSIFSDSVISYSIIMGTIYLAITVFAGSEIVGKYAGATNYILYGLNLGLTMAVGIFVLLSGVRMFLNELLPAFKGFSDRLVPGAVAAVDSPIFWSYAPKAALLGFITTVVGQFVGVGLLIMLGSPIIAIPSVIPLFFGGSTLGVFANSWGGWKGVIGATFIMGIITICGSAGLAYVSNVQIAIWGHSDWSTLWLGVFSLLKMFFTFFVA